MPPTLPSTESIFKIFQTLRAHVLAFETRSGETVADDVAERFWYNGSAAPDLAGQYPHVVGRFINQRITGGVRWRADLELMVYARPRSAQLAAETIADRVQASLLGYKQGQSGLLMVGIPSRDSIPPVLPPGDRELAQVRLLVEVIAYPELLGQYAAPGS